MTSKEEKIDPAVFKATLMMQRMIRGWKARRQFKDKIKKARMIAKIPMANNLFLLI